MRLLTPLYLWCALGSCLPLPSNARLQTTGDSWHADITKALWEVLQLSTPSDFSLIIITATSFSTGLETILGSSRGMAVFEAVSNGSRLPQVVTHARQVRLVSWMVVIVVVSDDPAFLAAFARQSHEGRLLVWATRLIVVIRRALHRLHPLHQTLSQTNSILLLVDSVKRQSQAGPYSSRATAWMVPPYRGASIAPVRVASWMTDSSFVPPQPLFREKFHKFSWKTSVLVGMEKNQRHSVVMQPDPTAPSGKRLHFKGFMVIVLEYLAQGLNFSYTFQRPPDGLWGAKMRDGSFTGMLGQVYGEKIHLGLGPFAINAARYEAVDFTWPISFVTAKVFAGRGSPEVDPWGFFLTLDTWVWVVLFSFLLVLTLTSFLSAMVSKQCLSEKSFAFISIMLRQSVWIGDSEWWWQRMVLGVWILMTMVLTRSYEGNLMSLLAVRRMAQPYQTLRAVLDDPTVVMVWHKQGSPIQAVMDATSGIFYEVKESEKHGRLKTLRVHQYGTILDDVMRQRKVIIDYDIITRATRSAHFSRTGRCDFYIGHETIQANPLCLISQKDSPLIPPLNARIMSMTEAGLYNYWNKEGVPNSSTCQQVPTKITVSSTLSLKQCWAMLLVLQGGLMVGLATLGMEVVLARVLDR